METPMETPQRELANIIHDLTTQAIKRLSPEQQQVFTLVHGITPDGHTNTLTQAETARQLNKPFGTVQSHYRIARANVYEYIATRMIEQVERRIGILYGTDNTQTTHTHHYDTHGISIRQTSNGRTISTQQHHTRLGTRSEAVMRADDTRATQQRKQQ